MQLTQKYIFRKDHIVELLNAAHLSPNKQQNVIMRAAI